MGHLGNPTAFRLGFQKNWRFKFFVKNLYYSELFHGLINVKDYIYYYFTNRLSKSNGGIFFSHLNIFNKLKKIYIYTYIYCAQIEKHSYEFMNRLYVIYFATYNKLKAEMFKKKKVKMLNGTNLSFFSRELNNSDLGVFYITYVLFYQKKYYKDKKGFIKIQKKKKNFFSFLKENYYYKSKINISFLKIINFYYINLLLKLSKEKWNIKTQSGRIKKKFRKTFYSKYYYLKNKNKKHTNTKLKSLWLVSKALISKAFDTWLLPKYRLNINKDKYAYYLNKFFKLNLQKKLYQVYKTRLMYGDTSLSFLGNKSQQFKRNLRDTLIDDKFMSFFDNVKNSKNYKKDIKIHFLYLFLYMAKKVNFKKVKHSKSLRNKWYIMYKYLNMFLRLKFVDISKSVMYDVHGFFFLMGLFITLSKNRKKGKIYFNLRDSIYMLVYYGIYYHFLHNIFDLCTRYLKNIIVLLVKGIFKSKDIFISYSFIKNSSVSSRLIAFYIGLKLRKNFPILKILNPLKYELMRVSRYSRNKFSLASIPRYLNKVSKNRRIFLKKWLRKYINIFYYLMDVIIHKYYKTNIGCGFITLNFFFYRLNVCKENVIRKKRNFIIKLLAAFFVHLVLNKKYKLSKKKPIYNFIKNYKLILIYPMMLNLNNYNWKKNITGRKNLNYYNNLYYFTLKNIYNILPSKVYKTINTKIMYIGSFFVRNLISYRLTQDLWLNYRNFNLRDLRQKYIPKYSTLLYGFKIIIKGRFSRKQRASKVIMNVGKVPLNTGDAVIDYTFLTIPLKNSAAGIKVYLYRSNKSLKYKHTTQF